MSRSLIFAIPFAILPLACWCSVAGAASHPQVLHAQASHLKISHPKVSDSAALDQLIAHYALVHGIPERLVRRVVARESGFNPHLVHKRYYGLMQITYQSARTMGYKGRPNGLLDPKVNLTYAVPYLANAYRAANGNETRAVRLYAAGYYYVAKHKHLLGLLRTAASPSLEPPPPPPAKVAPPPPPPNPALQLLQALTGQNASAQH
ncbi:MAG: transglycosylase SLT domain-containing protein [Methylovirgula sp.]